MVIISDFCHQAIQTTQYLFSAARNHNFTRIPIEKIALTVLTFLVKLSPITQPAAAPFQIFRAGRGTGERATF